MQDQAHNLRALMIQASLATANQCQRPQMLWITTGKGGVGTSTLIVNLAAALSRKGKRVLIASTTDQPRDLEMLCGLGHAKKNNEGLRQGPAGMLVLPQGDEACQSSLESRVRNLLKSLEAYHGCVDITIVDAGPRFRCGNCVPWRPLDTLIYVTTAESVAVMDTYAAIKHFMQDVSPPRPRIGLLVNRTSQDRQGRCTYERIANTCQRFLGTEVQLVGDIPHDRTLSDLRQSILPAVLQSPTSAVARAIDRVAAAVTKA